MAHTPFSGTVPPDRLYCPQYDMWVQKQDDGRLLIGATSFGVFLAGEIIAFTAKPKGAVVERGRSLGTVECHKTVLAVHAPVSFTIVEGNETAEARPTCVNADPYGKGWMVRGQTAGWDEAQRSLMDATAYRAHILTIEPEATFD